MSEPTPNEKTWALVRLLLGLGQVMGAVVSLYLLAEIGLNDLSMGAVVVTCALTSISVLLFGGRGSKPD